MNDLRQIAKIALDQQFALVVDPARNKAQITKEEWAQEVLLASRMAVNDGDFKAGLSGLETFGKAKGFLQAETTNINIAVMPDDVLAARARLEKEVAGKTIDVQAEVLLD